MAHTVAVLMLEPLVGFDATIPSLMFGQAGADHYRVITCGLSCAPVKTTSGYTITPEEGPSALHRADTVIIPGTRYPPARLRGELTEELRAAFDTIRPGTRIVSICTGAFVLAAAGLLDGRRATTHWHKADDFRALYPRVLLDEAVLFVDDGDVLTSAGLASGIDLCLHIIRRDHGTAAANAVARYCVVPPWREGGQAQFIDRPLPECTGNSTASARSWALENLTEPLTVRQLADHSRMSMRTFNRRFRDETGLSPGDWVRQQRVERARALLESHDLAVDEVARRSGLGSAANLRHHLRRGFGMSPTHYRKTFRGS
ncbi:MULTISPECIES: GlxA family transcriptional regulator [Mycobacteroides]|uniref:AraC family transcriptional regulator n=1 Tax=Mycobacteroides chelonae TaxID=1774 RepID=A0A1S1LRC2_MYCCH|nr:MULTISPECIES: helix-turn-helix domain-containing protein [Mycobacteroides]KRQ18706.1 AraC family transcriptional regulator [Mycobacteroides sp. H003]KRQ30382.1 AraC family transcriptional regulator [Mycobacteroides sp. H092]KRQ36364.1 AraC family transcriptional regulator [Mycobacteroides sp. H101]KRQ49541.1 AraC family transcriptional regulator [Mycobacteroides sp. H063]KRQ55848.1 AraC family transcriptional regulator [Mycobacteroides sp. HXVII]